MTIETMPRAMPTILEVGFQKRHVELTWPKSLFFIVMGSLCLAGLAQFEIRLPFSLVGITFQTLGVLLIGAALGAKRGALTVLLYLTEGAVGFPFFAGGMGGIAHLLGPTGGYLAGFVLCAYVAGFAVEKGWDRHWKTILPAFLIAHSCVFLLGASWLSVFVGWKSAVWTGIIPFIPGEILKTGLAASLLKAGWKGLGK